MHEFYQTRNFLIQNLLHNGKHGQKGQSVFQKMSETLNRRFTPPSLFYFVYLALSFLTPGNFVTFNK